MATKTRMSKKSKVQLQEVLTDTEKKGKPSLSPHLSSLMMLGTQLLSVGRFNEDLPSFITRGLDSEQIWQQLELRNEHKLAFPKCTRDVVRISTRSQQKSFNKLAKKSDTSQQINNNKADNGEESGLSSGSDSGAEDDHILESIKKRLTEKPLDKEDDGFNDTDDNDEPDELDFDFDVDNEIVKGLSSDEEGAADMSAKKKLPIKNKIKRTTVVDDKFFKLSDMEQFLEAEDLKEERRIKKESKRNEDSDDEAEESDDEEIDMFADEESDDELDPKYRDFFDPPDDEENVHEKKQSGEEKENLSSNSEDDDVDSEDNESDEQKENKPHHKFEESDGDDSAEDDEEDEKLLTKNSEKKVSFKGDLLQSDDEGEELPSPAKKKKENKSSFELKQEQLQAKAREMEELSLKEASWELMGEATASKRPENSLLETVLDFQHTTRAAPVITDDTTKSLEDYIKQRIKDKTFDDVERKNKPKEDVFEFKKRIVLDQEKSKMSLGELYEQEFVKKQQQEKDEVTADPECDKIEKELNKLFHQLDALSNFRYTPMKPGTEVKIIVNTPAITMEEVAPVATADSELLAPEEIREKQRGDLKAVDEKSSTDKKRDRRHKKQEKRERKKAKEAREKVVEKLKPGLGNKYSKAKALKQLEQISKSDKNVTVIKGEHRKLASTSFFTQLQEEVQTNARAKKGAKEKTKKIVDASKLML
ncbi:unnamed protein product [Lymnaea stagnalis]|uniref:U3 small nucleolar ribonucleoprotein protein MPP10 n=1 Tax=Lymnaea stagnalis TaxID=6523 RepID=A0AAV2IMJ5_LYMST